MNGFKLSDSDNYLCEPHCTVECIHGTCINPDSCECDVGYRLGYNASQSHICHPICDPEAEDNNGCINGTCVAPDTCQCESGFELDMHANYTCIALPPNKQMQQSGGHWFVFFTLLNLLNCFKFFSIELNKFVCFIRNRVSNALISALLLAVASCAVFYFIRKRRGGKLLAEQANGKQF